MFSQFKFACLLQYVGSVKLRLNCKHPLYEIDFKKKKKEIAMSDLNVCILFN